MKNISDHACTLYSNHTMKELDDFIGKFRRLQQAGKEANLVLNTSKKGIRVVCYHRAEKTTPISKVFEILAFEKSLDVFSALR